MITNSNIKRGDTVQTKTQPYKFATYIGPSQLSKEYFIAEDDETNEVRDNFVRIEWMPWDQES